MNTYHKHDHEHRSSTTKQTITPRSNPSTPQHEINSPPQPTRSHPKIKKEDQESVAHLGITIRWGVRAVARRQVKIPRGDLPIVVFDLVGGSEWC
jgi:hypothetical protein